MKTINPADIEYILVLREMRPIKKRWVIERTFTWFDYNRRLCRNYKTTFDSAEEMSEIAAIKLLLNKI